MATKKTSIGGQALIEGIMMRGPKLTAMAVRNTKTREIILEEYPTKGQDRAAFFKLPFIRGIFNMIDSLSFGYKCLMRSAELSGLEDEDENKTPTKWDKIFEAILMPVATVLAVALALGLFVYLPMQIWKWITAGAPAIQQNYYARAAFEGVMRILLFVGYVWATSLMKDIRRTYQYHVSDRRLPSRQGQYCRIYYKPDLEKMNEAARVLMEYDDFTSFAKLHTQVKTNICHLTEARWDFVPVSNHVAVADAPMADNAVTDYEWVFTIRSNRFLRNMVRSVTGTLLDVGRGKLTIDGLREIIEKKDRCAAGTSMPACGLFLTRVEYPQTQH